jgi:hypothetical protein
VTLGVKIRQLHHCPCRSCLLPSWLLFLVHSYWIYSTLGESYQPPSFSLNFIFCSLKYMDVLLVCCDMPNKWRALYRRPPISGIKLTGVFYDAFKSRNQKRPHETFNTDRPKLIKRIYKYMCCFAPDIPIWMYLWPTASALLWRSKEMFSSIFI